MEKSHQINAFVPGICTLFRVRHLLSIYRYLSLEICVRTHWCGDSIVLDCVVGVELECGMQHSDEINE